MARRATLAAIAVLVAGALAPGAWAHGIAGSQGRFEYRPPRPGTYTLPAIKPAADGRVLDGTGAARRLSEVMGGRIAVVSFIYTRCSDARGCPLATAVLHRLRDAAGRDAEVARNLTLVTMSFDLVHDTPAVLARYGGAVSGGAPRGPEWDFVVPASERDLVSILDGYGQVVQPAAGLAGGPSHLLRVYLVDREGRIRNIYGLDFLDPRLLLNDVRTLLLEERGGRR